MLGLEARQRRRPGQWRSNRPVSAPGLRVLGHLRQGNNCGCALLGRGGLIVSDIETARDELVGRGIDASEVWHGAPFPPEAQLSGPDPKRTSHSLWYRSSHRKCA